MKRSLIRQGNNSYTLTVPIDWVRNNDIKEGQDLNIDEEDSKLIISIPSDIKKQEQIASYDLLNYNERTIRNILNQAYRKGFDKIKLKYSNKTQLEDIKSIVKNTLLGFEVSDESDNICSIINIAEPSFEKFDVIFKKIYYLIKITGEEILSDFKSNKFQNLNKINEYKDQVDNYTNFARRVIIKYKVGGNKESYSYFYTASHLSLIYHAYYYMYKYAKEHNLKPSKEIINTLDRINKNFDIYFDAFFKKDLELAHKIGVEKDDILKNSIYKNLVIVKGHDNALLYHLGEIIRLIHLNSTVIFGFIEEKKY